jgi:hypothetical protein
VGVKVKVERTLGEHGVGGVGRGDGGIDRQLSEQWCRFMKWWPPLNIDETCADNMFVHRFSISFISIFFDEHRASFSYVYAYNFDLSVARVSRLRCLFFLHLQTTFLKPCPQKGSKSGTKRKHAEDKTRDNEIGGQQDHRS